MRSVAATVAALLLALPPAARAGDDARAFPHPDGPWWVSGQANVIFQAHPAFSSPYEGDHSLRPGAEHATSLVLTLFTGVRVGDATDIIVDVESASGRGISAAFGVAGFTNLDVVRNPTLGARPYLARAFVRHTFALGRETEPSERGPLSLASRLPVRRVDVRVGKLGTVDFFDASAVASDSHLQFENWTVDNNGAFDYAADTRGYTVGAEIEYQDRRWAVRFLEALMPKVANGIELDWDVGRARGENLEVELKRAVLPGREGRIRLLGYANHADMGDYARAVAIAPPGTAPDIESTRQRGRVKYGAGFNLEQQVSSVVRIAVRAGWNEGRHESFAYTEVDRTGEAAIDWRGDGWGRPHDRVGVAGVLNGISSDHRDYLARGGLGFLLGDGRLRYGPEEIVESYYTVAIGRGMSVAADVQAIWHPGYNRDRGPVVVPGVRVHAEF